MEAIISTSNSWDFSLTAAQICARVARNIGVINRGGTINTNDEADILQTLNIVAKEFQGTADLSPGQKIHTRQRVTLMLAKGQQAYLIGPAATDARSSTLIGRTTIDAAEAISQTVLSVAATSDTTTYPGTTLTMTAADLIGIEQDDGTIHWTTVSSIVAGDTVTVATGIAVAASVGNYVYWFTSRAQRFPVIESAVLRNSSYEDTPIEIYREAASYDAGVADKYADGTPTAILVEPLRINTRVTLNAQPTDVTDQIVMTVLYPAEDYDATTNDIAFPQEWLGYLEWETTLRSCPMFGKAWTPAMDMSYKNAMKTAKSLNPETSDLYYQPGL